MVTGLVVADVAAKVGDSASEEVAEGFFVVDVELDVISDAAAQDNCFELSEIWLEEECAGLMVEAHQVCVFVLTDTVVVVAVFDLFDIEGLSFIVGLEEGVD